MASLRVVASVASVLRFPLPGLSVDPKGAPMYLLRWYWLCLGDGWRR